jgi:hypothetical protein
MLVRGVLNPAFPGLTLDREEAGHARHENEKEEI